MIKEELEARLKEIESQPVNKSAIGFAVGFSEHCPMMQIVREADFNWLISALKQSWAREEVMESVLEEVVLPPYSDSNLSSLLAILKIRAERALKKVRSMKEEK